MNPNSNINNYNSMESSSSTAKIEYGNISRRYDKEREYKEDRKNENDIYGRESSCRRIRDSGSSRRHSVKRRTESSHPYSRPQGLTRNGNKRTSRTCTQEKKSLSSKSNYEKLFSRPPSRKTQGIETLLEGEIEKDQHRLNQRQKQLDFGKNTTGYDLYTSSVPRHLRKKSDPQTPNMHLKMSKRAWDGIVRKWRIALHKYDPSDQGSQIVMLAQDLDKKLVNEKAEHPETHEVTEENRRLESGETSQVLTSIYDDFDDDEDDDLL